MQRAITLPQWTRLAVVKRHEQPRRLSDVIVIYDTAFTMFSMDADDSEPLDQRRKVGVSSAYNKKTI